MSKINLLKFYVLSCIILFTMMSKTIATSLHTSARSSILMDAISGRVLYEKNAYEVIPMASTTKIMTAIVAIEEGNLESIVVVSKKAANIGGTSIDLYEGEKQKLEDLLYGLMLVSGNDAAIAIAEHISGSEEEFAKLMTKKAIEIGAKNTQFKNAHGLDQEGHYTTAYDLALITKYAMKNKEFRKIVGTKRRVIPDDRSSEWDRGLRNKNKLLYEYEGCLGVKTGYTSKAGQCFVGAAQKNGMEVITVVLHDTMSKQPKWIDTKNMFDYAFNHFQSKKVLEKGQYIKTLPIQGGEEELLTLRTQEEFSIILKEKEKDFVSTEVKLPLHIEAPIQKNQKIGVVQISFKNKLVKEVPLLSEKEVKEKKIWTNKQRLLKNWLNLIKEGII